MFSFYMWQPYANVEWENVFLDINWFGECVGWWARDLFIKCWINDILIELDKPTIWSWNRIFIRYEYIEDNLEKIRYTSKIHWTDEDDLWIDRIIKSAIEKYGEEDLFCMFS
jgi:hypothetical protein